MTTEPNTETKTPTLTALLPDTELRLLSCKLTEEEFKARSLEAAKVGREASDQEHEIERIKERAKADVKVAEEKHDQLSRRLDSLFRILTNGAEDREVRCVREYNRGERRTTIRRQASGEVVDTRDMTDEEIRRGCAWVFDYPARKKRLTHPEGDVVEVEDLTDAELQVGLSIKAIVALSGDDWTRINEKAVLRDRVIRPAGADEDIAWEGQMNGTVTAEVTAAQRDALRRFCKGLDPSVALIDVGGAVGELEEQAPRKVGGRRGRASATA